MKKLLPLFLILLTLNLQLKAQSTNIQTTPPKGEGTEQSPYLIGTAQELFWYAETINNGQKRTSWAELTDNIVLNEHVLDTQGELNGNGENFVEWKPIGTTDNNNSYAGTLDGKGHYVSGIYINGNKQFQGFFGYASSATIRNVGVRDSYIRGDSRLGGICGKMDAVRIYNCYSNATIEGNGMIGGICGVLGVNVRNDYWIGNCYNTGKLTAQNSQIGGICGISTGQRIYNCYNTGTITGGDDSNEGVGGICGFCGQVRASIISCFNLGKVRSYSTYRGSICGWFTHGTGGTLENCFYLEGTAYTGIGVGEGDTQMVSAEQIAQEINKVAETWTNNASYDAATDVLTLPTLSDEPAPTIPEDASTDITPSPNINEDTLRISTHNNSIELATSQPLNVSVYDPKGCMRWTGKVDGAKEIDNLKPGIYIVNGHKIIL